MKLTYLITLSACLVLACNSQKEQTLESPYIMVLGIAQDAGYPQMNCKKACCKDAWENPKKRKMTSCLAIVDPTTNQQWILDATPNIKDQLQLLKSKTGTENVDGVLLTHAHVGHYTGLMHFGREVMGSSGVPVYVMPKMKSFLEENGPWSQLVNLKNISLSTLKEDSTIQLNERIQITPFLVPHRDEFSETVGFRIETEEKSAIFIPDIDKWEKWNRDIVALIKEIDYAFLDATFYKNGELKRDMSEIPHPFVEESMDLFFELSIADKRKVHFIHLNHTNPLLQKESPAQREVKCKEFNVAREGAILHL
ncbi:MAG: MBL fold metallo-hydrolase [Bacteroidota bacterium]|nr:MBL fold metallo-hydrolase [Bacteroidota bacterium]